MLLVHKVLIFENPMSSSNIESLPQETKDLEKNNEKDQAQKENTNENMESIELNATMEDTKDFLIVEEKEKNEDNEVEVLEEEKKKEKKKKSVTMIDPPKCTSSDSGFVSDFLRSKKEVKWCIALLGLRIAAFLLCLISFSVLAANEQRVLVKKSIVDWFATHEYSLQKQYSFHWYEYDEFKFSFTASVVAFVYSGLQIGDLLRYLITKKHTVDPKLRGYCNVAIDQVLAYILMSASSSAAARAHIERGSWVEHGGQQFTEMANVSIAMSFFAFVAFAFTTLISGLILSRFT